MCADLCDFCKKEGFPIMPVRYAIAPGNAKIPGLAKGLNVSIPVKGGDMKYGVRTLRGGYLYVFDEKHKRWYAYVVTPKGYFCSFPIDKAAPASVSDPEKHDKPCINQPDRMARSAFITIPPTASTVWLTFSDVEWTAAIKKRHDDVKYRQDHMQSFNVSGWIASQKASHAVPIAQLKTTVAEYSATALSAGVDFRFCPAGWYSHPSSSKDKVDRAKALIDAATALSPKSKGAILALQDPCGVTQDIAALMQARLRTHLFDHKERRRPLAISSTIQQLEQAVKNQAELDELFYAESLADATEMGEWDPVTRSRNPGAPPKMVDRIRTVTSADLDRAADNAWRKYLGKYSEATRKKWQTGFDAIAKKFDQEIIVPMAELHVAWMKSTRLASAFSSNYDPANIETGLVYARMVMLSIAGTQDKKICFDLYYDCLKGDLTNIKHPVMRALILNQDKLATALSQAVKGAGVNWLTLPWDSMVSAFGGVVAKVLDGVPDTVGRLLLTLSGPLMKLMQQAAEGPVYQSLVALGAIAQHPVVPVTLEGSKKAFRELLVKQLLKQTGIAPKNANDMNQAVAAEIRRLGIRGVKMDGRSKQTFLLLIDQDMHPNFKSLSASQRAIAAAKLLRTPDQIDKINMTNWRSKLASGAQKAKVLSPFVFGIVAGLFQVVGLSKMEHDLDVAMAHRKEEAAWRKRAGMMALAGTFTDLAGQGLAKVAPFVLRKGLGTQQIMIIFSQQVGKWGGRLLGIFAAGVMAWWDKQNAQESWDKGQKGMAILYGSSAVVGFAAALCIIWFPGIGLILATLYVAIAILIEISKDTPLQEWLEHCFFGSHRSFTSLENEMQELEKALKA